jgi:asparagine synthase (glutamine-hydrolysing)
VAARLRYMSSLRAMALGLAAVDLVAGEAGATISHPLYDPGLWASVAARAPRRGFTDREAALRLAAGHALPEAVIARRTKAHFNEVFFTGHARGFVERWSGAGLPEDLVDVEALRAHWLTESPDAHSYTLLQLAWLASTGDRSEQAVGRGLQ